MSPRSILLVAVPQARFLDLVGPMEVFNTANDLLVHRGIRCVIRAGKKGEGVKRVRGARHMAARDVFPYDVPAMAV